jgi:nucleotide-binding universal stress UspA family protein
MKILLAIDESEFSEAATRAVISHFPAAGTRVCVLHAAESLWYSGPEPLGAVEQLESLHEDAIRRGKELVARAEKALREAGFETSALVVEGDPRAAIVEQAEKQPADVIVMGSHGRRGWRRLILGSVSEAVVRYAPCSVFIVRAPESARPA